MQNSKTYSQKTAQVERAWHLLDAQSLSLGRLATVAARLLIGKHKATYTPHIEAGDYVVIINAQNLKVTGQKLHQKKYYRHSGFIGNLKTITLKQQKEKDPCQVIYLAVKGMLPKNKLQKERLKNLKIYVDENHAHAGQKPVAYEPVSKDKPKKKGVDRG